MNSSTGHLQSKMSWTTGKSPGWAAFDRKQRKKHSDDLELDIDPYPPIANLNSSIPTVQVRDNSSTVDKISLDKCEISTLLAANLIMNDFPPRSFSSVVQTSADSAILNNSKGRITADNFASSLMGHGQYGEKNLSIPIAEETNSNSIIERLKMRHTWADKSLINDIFETVNNDEDQACTLLSSMVSAGSEGTELAEPSVLENGPVDKKAEQVEQGFQIERQLVDGSCVKLNLGQLASAPIEPEWVEDDIYLSHRKDAIRMTRLAVQHSNVSSNAFSRGDHFAAQQYSLKARDAWLAAEKLNAKAAEEILHIRNSRNDVWKLDLHGLHASEAVHALEIHLNKIESGILTNHSLSLDRTTSANTEIGRCSSATPIRYIGMEGNKEQPLLRQRQSVLQVITGTGNNSRGEATLPTAVMSFLTTNGYRFHEARPGVIAVSPKFRQKVNLKSESLPCAIPYFRF